MASWAELATTFGVALVGGVVAPQVTQVRERRGTRAEAAERLCRVEEARWWPVSYEDFRTAIASFEAAALVAGIRRDLVSHYVGASRVAKYASQRSGPSEDGDAYGGEIDPRLNRMAWAAAELIRDCLWHPWASRLVAKRRLCRLTEDCAVVRNQLPDQADVRWDLLKR